jgi:hypothetical protein
VSSRFVPASPNYTVSRKRNPIEDSLPRMSWLERVKTDFRFAGPGYRVKTRGQAIRLLLSPFWPVPDLIAPSFIQSGDRLYAKPVETLVLAMRGLMSKSYREALQNLRRIPLYNAALTVLREWDVEGINRELTLLQREPRDRTFSDFQPLLTPLLRPLFQLSRLNPHVHILPGLAKMLELGRMYMTNNQERELIQRYYTVAREQLPLVFGDLRQRLYPVLLKLLSDHLLEPEQFYLDKEEAIWALLGLTESDLIKDLPDSLTPQAPVTMTAEPQEAPPEPVPRLARRGFELLDDLFPRAGWQTLEETPDLFSYFQSLLEFPKGSDHIPVDDAIQIIQPLSEVLQQLFYGFQNIEWGTSLNENGEVVRLQEELDKRVARWHFFHEEFFGKNYLPLLQEYCREIERAGPISNDARRREHQLLWFKRNYLLPHLSLPVMDDVRVKSLGYPNLSVQVREMLDLLAPITIELDQKGNRSGAIVNPEMKVRFPVSSMVSQRFQHALRRMGAAEGGERRVIDQGNNRALLFYTVALLSSLDDLLSRPTSVLYAKTPKYLYRTSGAPGDDKPVYNAPNKNSLSLLKKLNEQLPADIDTVPWPTRGDDLYGSFMVLEDLKLRMREHRAEKKPFCLLAIQGRRTMDREVAQFATGFDADLRLHLMDDGSCCAVLGDTTEEAAEDAARGLLEAAARRDPPLALAILVVPYAPSWQPDKMLAMPAKGWAAAAAIPPQVLGMWMHGSQTFEFRTNVSTIDLGAASAHVEPEEEESEEEPRPEDIPVDELPPPEGQEEENS